MATFARARELRLYDVFGNENIPRDVVCVWKTRSALRSGNGIADLELYVLSRHRIDFFRYSALTLRHRETILAF